ncbi:MAG: ATP-binding protein [Eubacteriales bacterium]
MAEKYLTYEYNIDGENFTTAGEASVNLKRVLRRIGFAPEVIKRASIAMYEGEINMVIHAGGGVARVNIYEDKIVITLDDNGPGIADVELAMKEGYSTAPDKIRSMGFGAGMGLPNMKRNADKLEISTRLGEGTTITMTITVAATATAND